MMSQANIVLLQMYKYMFISADLQLTGMTDNPKEKSWR